MSGPYVPSSRYSPRQMQPLDNFVGSAKDVLQGLVEQSDKDLPPFAQALKEQHEQVRAAAARLFNSADGRVVLEYLCDATLRRPTFIAHLNLDPKRAYAHGVLREGQNTAVFLLLALIAEGRGEQPVQREGATT